MLRWKISIDLSTWIRINRKYMPNGHLCIWSKVNPTMESLTIANREEAMKDFEEAIMIDPNDPDIYYHRGQVRFLMGEFSNAANDYQKSADLDKKFVYSQVQLGVAQYKLGQTKDALVTFRKCIKNFKNSAEV